MYTKDIIETPFFQAMKKMNSFKGLIVQIDSYYAHKGLLLETLDSSVLAEAENQENKGSYYDSLIPDRIPCKDMIQWLDENIYGLEYAEGTYFMQQIRADLEPALGSCTEDDVPEAYNVAYSRYIEFHPREHCIKKLRAEIARLAPDG